MGAGCSSHRSVNVHQSAKVVDMPNQVSHLVTPSTGRSSGKHRLSPTSVSHSASCSSLETGSVSTSDHPNKLTQGSTDTRGNNKSNARGLKATNSPIKILVDASATNLDAHDIPVWNRTGRTKSKTISESSGSIKGGSKMKGSENQVIVVPRLQRSQSAAAFGHRRAKATTMEFGANQMNAPVTNSMNTKTSQDQGSQDNTVESSLSTSGNIVGLETLRQFASKNQVTGTDAKRSTSSNSSSDTEDSLDNFFERSGLDSSSQRNKNRVLAPWAVQSKHIEIPEHQIPGTRAHLIQQSLSMRYNGTAQSPSSPTLSILNMKKERETESLRDRLIRETKELRQSFVPCDPLAGEIDSLATDSRIDNDKGSHSVSVRPQVTRPRTVDVGIFSRHSHGSLMQNRQQRQRVFESSIASHISGGRQKQLSLAFQRTSKGPAVFTKPPDVTESIFNN